MPTSTTLPSADYVSFKELFGQDRCFVIPDYQRGYDWGEKQRKDLLTDLDKLGKLVQGDGQANHFCGTITCIPASGKENTYEVVDGQQRLTTLVMIYTYLCFSTEQENFLYRPGNLRFMPQAIDQYIFGKLLGASNLSKPSAEQAETTAQKNYVQAWDEIKTWANRSDVDTRKMAALVEDHLGFILLALGDDAAANKVFETINNRGKPLTQMDLVKNHLMFVAQANKWGSPNVNEVWERINRKCASPEFEHGDMDMVLRAVVTAQFKPGRRKADETDYSIVASEIPADGAAPNGKTTRDNFEKFLYFLEESYETLSNMRLANSTDAVYPVKRALTCLNHHGSLTGVLPLLLARQHLRKDKSENKKDAPVLRAIEIANFRLYGLPGVSSRTDSHHVKFHNLAHDYFKGDKTDDDVISELQQIVKSHQPNGTLAIVQALSLDDSKTGLDFYKWPWLRYFLARFEEHLLDKQSFDYSKLQKRARGGSENTNDVLTIEHICAQKPKEEGQKQKSRQDKKFLQVYESKDRQQIRRLGNLMMIPNRFNIQLSNDHVVEKMGRIQKKNDTGEIQLLTQNIDAIKCCGLAEKFREHLLERSDHRFGDSGRDRYNGSTKDDNDYLVTVRTLCDLREEKMIRFALNAWRFDGEEYDVSDFKGVFSFSFEGETYVTKAESSKNKLSSNYIVAGEGELNDKQTKALARLEARNEVMGLDPDRE